MKLKSMLIGALALGCACAFGDENKESAVAQKLQTCDFLLNKDFKKNAKYYLCLFSASWCGPCRREMPRIVNTYAEILKADPDIELIHFSRDQNDEKALAWAKEHDVKFPVVKPNGGNPLELHCNGIPHLFIVKADGTLVEEGHPAGLFTEEKICALTGITGKESVDGYTWSYCAKNGEATIVATGKNEHCSVSPRLAGSVAIPSTVDGHRVTRIGRGAFQYCRALTSVTIPKGVTSIGENAFCQCEELMSVTIPDGVTRIGGRAFSGCRKLSSVPIPLSVTSIGDWAFGSCDKLSSVTIPKGVVQIGTGVFSECNEMTRIDVETGNQKYMSIDGVLYTKDGKSLVACPGGLTSVTVSPSVCDIQKFSLTGCAGLKRIDVATDNSKYASSDGVLYTKDKATLLACPGGMSSVAIPQGVKSVGEFAFRDCRKLSSVTFPASVASIGWCAFSGCSGLTDVTIPSGVTSLPGYAFQNCRGLTSLTIPSSVKRIAHRAFGGCSGLKSLLISEGVTQIDSYAFTSCAGLTSVALPASVKSLERDAFCYCRNLASLTMRGERPKAQDNVFRSCDKLTEIHVPVNARSWAGMREWQGKPLVFDVKADAAGTSVDNVSTATEKTRKALAKLFPGWSLDTEVFDHDFAGIQTNHRGLSNVTFVHPRNQENPAIVSRTVTLSDQNPCLFIKLASHNEEADFLLSVRVNGQTALPTRLICTPDFEPWQDLVVPLSDWRGKTVKVELVFNCNGWWCEFANLSRLEISEGKGDMRITEGTETVNGYTWSYRTQHGEATIIAEKDGKFSRAVSPCPIGQLTIPATLGGAKVTRIGREALGDCTAVTSITIPQGVTRIGRQAFHNCNGLKSVTIPSSVKILERDAFAGCNALSSVMLPDGLTCIDRGAFYWCSALPSIAIPSSVTYIGQDAFRLCLRLASVTIPQGVENIGWQTFRECKALTTVTIPASVTNISFTAFCDTLALTSFRVEEGNRFYKSQNGLLLTKDGKTLVHGVNGDVTIPSSVTTIGPCAFEGCWSLRPIVIPNSVKSIGDYAFKQCRNMTSVTIPEGVTDIGREAFNNCGKLESLTIPSSVQRIEQGAFNGCGSLTSLMIPSTVANIDRTAFDRCSKLKSVSVVTDGKAETLTFGEFQKKWKMAQPGILGRNQQPKNAAEREKQRKDLLKIQDELKRAREAKAAAEAKGKDSVQKTIPVAQQLQTCDFLLNKDFKKNAKYYLCLFSASWCGPCRAEMPRIAKTYAEQLKADPDIELIHFSRDQNDEKALAWAKEHDVKFPVVKPNGGNPLALHCNGIPHLFIVKADCTIVEDGHPMSLFTDEKFLGLKAGTNDVAVVNGDAALKGPYGIRMQPDPGCEKGAAYVLSRLRDVYLPCAVRYYGDPFCGKSPSRVFTIRVKRNDGSDKRKYTGPSWGSCSDGADSFTVGLAKGADKWEMDLTLIASKVLTVCGENDGAAFHLYVNRLINGDVKDVDATPRLRLEIRQRLEQSGEESERDSSRQKHALLWAVLEELRAKHPGVILDYCTRKNARHAEGRLPGKVTLDQMAGILSEVTGEDVHGLFGKYGVRDASSCKAIGNCPSGLTNRVSSIFMTNTLFTLSGPYGIRIQADPGCEKAAEYILKRLVDVYLPRAKGYYGDPFRGNRFARVYTIDVVRNERRGISYRPGVGSWWIGLGQGCDKCDCSLDYLASSILTVCEDAKWASFVFYVNRLAEMQAKGEDPGPRLKADIQRGLAADDDRNRWYRAHAPLWAALEEMREKHPTFISEYCELKNQRFVEGKLPKKISLDQMSDLLREVTGEDVAALFKKHVVEDNVAPGRTAPSSRRTANASLRKKGDVASQLQSCDFLLNKDFKKNAKYYLCLFSASWCGPCRAEMPRIAKTYAEQLKADPDIELIHFSRDQNDEKALAWAKEHNVKFPVVKPNGGNPLNLHARGIPHLFILKADGTLLEEGHPMKLFTDEKLRSLRGGK